MDDKILAQRVNIAKRLQRIFTLVSSMAGKTAARLAVREGMLQAVRP